MTAICFGIGAAHAHYAVASYNSRRAVVIFTNHPNGIHLCQNIAQHALGHSVPHPAFAWIAPLDHWKPDGCY